MFGPVIKGRLVTLRPPRAEEAVMLVTWFEDREITRFMKLQFPPSLDAEKEWLEKMAKGADDIVWAIEMSNRLIGVTGIHKINWPQQRASTGTLIGDKSAWGKGIATEVMALRTRFAFTQLPLRKLHSSVIDGNEASLRAQRKAGYREVGRYHEHWFRDGRWRDEILTEVLKSDWLLANPD
ncbi:MAG: GNAT family N-acetyltransferase [Candidatus Dormibacteraeota bacterium]|nr:GNAT family N-acetyltransferase [Candidatus Dormibacteraeota bacterium]